ncbi:hypothetical protein ACQKKK_00575 [Peribacillus sp. NPDC006672]|uniref:hypothetical protein n=1 Tax=Peribacillus sp. NPDC006672 TaxID=3390606 RepID=UPI003D06215A
MMLKFPLMRTIPFSKKWFNFVRAGKLIYQFIFIKKLFSYQPSGMELIIDENRQLLKKVWFVVIANQQTLAVE